MNVSMKVNPLKHDALTTDTISSGDRIRCWTPNKPETVRNLVVLNDPYTDGDGDQVVEVRHLDGRETVELASDLGLSGYRYSGEWTAIAIIDDSAEN